MELSKEDVIDQAYGICQSSEYLKHVWKVHIREAVLSGRLHVVASGPELIAFIEALPYKREMVVHFKHMGVKEEFRRRGIMTKLLQECEMQYRDRYIKIETRATNEPMNSFLKKHGYRLLGTKTVGSDIVVNIYGKPPRPIVQNTIEDFI